MMMYGRNLNKAPKRTNSFYEWDCPFCVCNEPSGNACISIWRMPRQRAALLQVWLWSKIKLEKIIMSSTMKFDYYYGIEAEQFSFYRVPRLLIKDERFKGLSSDAHARKAKGTSASDSRAGGGAV
jgi:hypothetical protein